MAKPEAEALGPQSTLASVQKQAATKPGERLLACALVRREGKWAVLELTIANGSVVATRQVDAQYYRDLAEDAVRKWIRTSAR